jgi:hypothetical protein
VSVRLPTAWKASQRQAVIVVRCDSGNVDVEFGAAQLSQPCSGHVDQVVLLPPHTDDIRIRATVSGAQRDEWGLAVYR